MLVWKIYFDKLFGASKTLNYLSFDFWVYMMVVTLFQKRIMRTTFDIYVFIK
jgi:hypothetical protein